MKKLMLLLTILTLCYITVSDSNQNLTQKQETKMADVAGGGGGGGGWGDGVAQTSGAYWIGADGKVYVKGANGVNAAGVADANTDQYWGNLGYDRINDPNPPTNGWMPGGSGVLGDSTTNTGGSALAFDPSAYNQQIGLVNSSIDRLGTQQETGNSNIEQAYQSALQQLLGQRNQSQQSYDTGKQTNATNYVTSKNTIGSQAGGMLNGLQRLLGSRGAGGGSAYLQAAPGAVTRQASLQRADVGDQFGQKQKGLDQSWGNYLQGYNNSVGDLGNQKANQMNSLQASINTNRASLLQSLAQLTGNRDQAAGGNGVASAQPYLDQSNTLLNQAAQLGKTVNPFSYNSSAYTAPSASSYTVAPQQAASFNSNQSQSNDYFSPYLQALLGKKQQFGAA